eukprot:547488_1
MSSIQFTPLAQISSNAYGTIGLDPIRLNNHEFICMVTEESIHFNHVHMKMQLNSTPTQNVNLIPSTPDRITYTDKHYFYLYNTKSNKCQKWWNIDHTNTINNICDIFLDQNQNQQCIYILCKMKTKPTQYQIKRAFINVRKLFLNWQTVFKFNSENTESEMHIFVVHNIIHLFESTNKTESITTIQHSLINNNTQKIIGNFKIKNPLIKVVCFPSKKTIKIIGKYIYSYNLQTFAFITNQPILPSIQISTCIPSVDHRYVIILFINGWLWILDLEQGITKKLDIKIRLLYEDYILHVISETNAIEIMENSKKILCKRESDGCPVHGMGEHIEIIQSKTVILSMICNQCNHALVDRIERAELILCREPRKNEIPMLFAIAMSDKENQNIICNSFIRNLMGSSFQIFPLDLIHIITVYCQNEQIYMLNED